MTQIHSKVYFGKKYNSPERFLSYYSQIKSLIEVNPGSVLEIGVGNKIVTNYLKEMGVTVTTVDFDAGLEPDHVLDIRNPLPFADNSFDTVVAFEVLEHIPFGEVPCVLKELQRVARNQVIVSLPNKCLSLEFGISIKGNFFKVLGRKLNSNLAIKLNLRIPTFTDITKNKQHYWEIGSWGYSKTKVIEMIKANSLVTKHYVSDFPGHYFIHIMV